ncbi:MAG TPA: hypothetical protein VNW54_08625 [Granulicella sp.]|jgi:hypothetical protein|nr:hypothetical protein [Granulicella sp.]
MDLIIHLVAKILVPLFLIGLAGSSVVVLISFVEDLRELLGHED